MNIDGKKRDVEVQISKPVGGQKGFRISARRIRSLILLFTIPLVLNGSGGKMKEMNFYEFREYLKSEGVEECVVFFDGKETAAAVTGHRYVFLQVVTYCGESDVMSSYRTWNSEDEFIMVYKNFRIKLSPSSVRTFTEKTGSFEQKESDDGRVLPSLEFGLVKNKKYFVKISSEEYHLPPDRESGKPQKRTNYVLWISSRPFKEGKPQVELTPIYRHWSY